MKNLFILAIILLTSCEHDPISSSSTSNPDGLKVDLLFHIDSTYTPGVYRFMDAGHYHYFVISPFTNKCDNTYKSGKSTNVESIETIEKK